MSYENHQLFHRCRQLKRQSLLHSVWFFCNCIYMKVGKNSDATRIKHVCDIEKALNMKNIDSYLGINVQISLVTTRFETLSKVFKFFFLTVICFNSISDSKYKVSIHA